MLRGQRMRDQQRKKMRGHWIHCCCSLWMVGVESQLGYHPSHLRLSLLHHCLGLWLKRRWVQLVGDSGMAGHSRLGEERGIRGG